jgi:hypothetical protein
VSKTGAALTNANILKLKRASPSEQLTLDKIKSAPAAFSLETDDLLALKTVGVSDAIISAMIEAQQQRSKGTHPSRGPNGKKNCAITLRFATDS